MTDASENCNSEEPQSQVGVRFRANEEEASDQKSRDVLQVIQMGSSNSLDFFVFFDLTVFMVCNIFGVLKSLEKLHLLRSFD